MREYAAELNAPSQDEDSQRRKRKKEKKEEVYKPRFILSNLNHDSLGTWQWMLLFHPENWLLLSFFSFPQDDINTIDMEEDKRDLISREISKFRDTHKVKWLFWSCSWHFRFWTAVHS